MYVTFPTSSPEPSKQLALARVDGQADMLARIASPLLTHVQSSIDQQERMLSGVVRQVVASVQERIAAQHELLLEAAVPAYTSSRERVARQAAELRNIIGTVESESVVRTARRGKVYATGWYCLYDAAESTFCVRRIDAADQPRPSDYFVSGPHDEESEANEHCRAVSLQLLPLPGVRGDLPENVPVRPSEPARPTTGRGDSPRAPTDGGHQPTMGKEKETTSGESEAKPAEPVKPELCPDPSKPAKQPEEINWLSTEGLGQLLTLPRSDPRRVAAIRWFGGHMVEWLNVDSLSELILMHKRLINPPVED